MAKKPKTRTDLEREQEQLLTAYIRCFRSGEGEVVLKDLQRALYYDNTTLTPLANGKIDPLAVAAREGMRRAYMYITSMVAEGEHARSGDTGTRIETGDVFDSGDDERDERSIN